jgi:hypothetical protein
MGIILNDGVMQPTANLEHIRLGAGTPYETEMVYRPPAAERVLASEVSQKPQAVHKLRGMEIGVTGNATNLSGSHWGSTITMQWSSTSEWIDI